MKNKKRFFYHRLLFYILGLLIMSVGSNLFLKAALGVAPSCTMALTLSYLSPIHSYALFNFLINSTFLVCEALILHEFGKMQLTQLGLTFVYSLFVPKNISEVTIKASLEDSKASFVSGYAPRKVTLKQGANTVYIKIKAEDGTIKTYTLGITRSNGEDTNNLLSNIELSSGEIDFKPEVTIYTISVSNDVKELKVNAKATSLLAKVEVSDTLLKVGENKITITVTPESGDKKVYQLIVNREEFDSKDNYLKSLSIDGYDIDFKKDVFNYELSIKNESSLKINAVKEMVNSSVSIIGNKELVNGSKVIIRVTDVDGNIRDYTINITKSVLFDLSYKMIILFAEFIIILILLLVIIFRPKNKGVKRNNRNINRHGGNGRKINFVNNKVCRKCGAINDPLAIVCYLCGTELK